MTLTQLEKRVKKLEAAVEQLQSTGPVRNGRWWVERASPFENDPVYAAIARLGRKYRESLRPKRRKSAK